MMREEKAQRGNHKYNMVEDPDTSTERRTGQRGALGAQPYSIQHKNGVRPKQDGTHRGIPPQTI